MDMRPGTDPSKPDRELPAAAGTLAEEARAALAVRDRDALRRLLHPYLRWIDEAEGRVIVGRRNVINLLQHVAPPRGVELRDGQIYRWYA